MDPYTYRAASRGEGTFTGDLVAGWTPLYLDDFRGITEDGTLRDDVHPLEPARPGEEAPVAAMVSAAEDFLAALGPDDRTAATYAMDAPEWQTWANPEFLQFDTGVRLEFQPADVQRRALALLAASLSPEGYELAHDMMLINGFLGELVGLQSILNEFSYNMAIYGTPDVTSPWGWQIFGHHMAVNCFVVAGRMVVSPAFFGAEPNEIDEGARAGVTAFTPRIDTAIELIAALSPEQRSSATTYERMVDPSTPHGRVHPGDERHLAGAFQDNREILFEGVRVSELSEEAQRLVLALVEQFVALLPDGPRTARMREVRECLAETWFSWIGGHHPGDVFYYRIQSPVVIAELDHHCGVFLDYDSPKPFHIHTVLRTPHGNDYGRSYLSQWRNAQ
ncbi:DUF3500 domain-containing protein [Rhodococcus sp. MEB041]|uniref:DUF3500 domain-containing protein n=1 Tax=Rhodococcus sp. MEB041 TaxID=3040323 RepID=UPI00254B6A51|nr:DUF3500 domain-containing protein [Rhodococcus sp. MEB041]